MNFFHYFNGKKNIYITYSQRKTLFKKKIIQTIDNMFSLSRPATLPHRVTNKLGNQ